MPLGIISSSSGMASACRTINNSAAWVRWNKNGSSILSFSWIEEMEIFRDQLLQPPNGWPRIALQYFHDFISQIGAVPISPAPAYVLRQGHRRYVVPARAPTLLLEGNHRSALRRQRPAWHGELHWYALRVRQS